MPTTRLTVSRDSASASEQGSPATQLAAATLDSLGDGVVSTDTRDLVTYLNPVACRLTGWSLADALGRPLHEVLRIIDGESREPAVNPLRQAIDADAPVGIGPNAILVRRDGQEVAIEDTATPIHDPAGRITGAVIVFRDVSAARAMSARLNYLAQHDPLTGLPNRLLLSDRLQQSIALAQRHHKSLALMFVDVDHFKSINDTLGHDTGDEVLRETARRIVSCVRESDTVSRLGGDEFVILLPEVALPGDAGAIADKVVDAMATMLQLKQLSLAVSVSIGIGVYPQDGTDPETLLRHADVAMLAAKVQGRGNRQFFHREMSSSWRPTAQPAYPRLVSVRPGALAPAGPTRA